MPDSVLCVVRIPYPQDVVDAIEAANPDVIEAIVNAAARHMTRHRRAADADSVIETEEFPSQAAFDAFMAEAGDAVERYDEMLGDRPLEMTVYRFIDEDDSWLEVNR